MPPLPTLLRAAMLLRTILANRSDCPKECNEGKERLHGGGRTTSMVVGMGKGVMTSYP